MTQPAPAHMQHDHVLLIDGPLEGHTLCVTSGLSGSMGVTYAMTGDPGSQRVQWVEGDPPGHPARGALVLEAHYQPVIASDGHPSRGDDGRRRYRLCDPEVPA